MKNGQCPKCNSREVYSSNEEVALTMGLASMSWREIP
jgi:hypothetical protein